MVALVRKYVDELMDEVEGLTFLERRAVGRRAEKYYVKDFKM